MNEIWEVLKYIFPMLVLGAIVYFILERMLKEETAKRNLELKLRNTDLVVPQRLQAYERLALYLERIRPTNLIRRIELQTDLDAYEYVLVNAIQEEYDHNLSQQIYIDPESWKLIFSAKNATQNFIKQCRNKIGSGATAEGLRDEIIKNSIDGNSSSNAALLKLQADVQGGF